KDTAGGLTVIYPAAHTAPRDRDLDEGMRQLAGALRDLGRPLDELCDDILSRLLAAPAQDDVAILLARTTG
ncbi:hypothetical protein ACFV6U_33765, partial [Streptomyces sp. NPDC059810]|uniref:hypothetical protein n=1 Tax=Streptomyces sp. NPDC059810 TaxID=3346956 RepID=UPI00365855C2